MNEFLQFYLQKYFNFYLFKKSDFVQIIKKKKNITLFAKEFIIKRNKK